MSGKSCVLRMHAASAVNDRQQRKPLVTTTKATASPGTPPANGVNVNNNNNAAISNNPGTAAAAGASPAAPPAVVANGINSAAAVAAPVNTTTQNNGAKPPPAAAAASPSSRIKLPLPPRGTGIRHNVQVSSEIAAPSKGVPRGAAAAAAASPRRVVAPPKKGTDNKHAQARKAKKRPANDTRMDEGDDHAEDSDDGSDSASDDDSITTSSSFDSDATSDLDDSNSSFSSSSSAGPQHQQVEMETETVSPDLEYAVIAHRKKGLILSRLSEVSQRGTLSVINLARRGLGVNDVALIEQVILGNPKLSVLKLGYNDLGDLGAHCLANALCVEQDGHLSHRALGVLDLCFNGIGDDGCGGLAMKAIAGNYHLRTLFLSGNNIGEKGALSIAGALVHGCYLSRLHLTANKIGPEGTKALATAVAEIDARVQMQEAAVSNMAAAMGGAISQHPLPKRMEHLFLGSTAMETTGFYAMPSMLLSNTSLRVLCLTDNNIEDKDMSLLAQALTQNKNVPLESIMLSHNQITCAGVESLMNSIWGSPTLSEIKIDNNKVQDRGAQLCAVVLTSVKLRKLDVGFNSITTVGVRALMKSLSEDTNMQSLGICGIPVDLNAAKAVSFALAYNTALQTVNMDNCQVGYSAQRHITAGIVSNQRAPLQLLTGFPMGPIAVTLGMPALPEEWSNEKVLAFVRMMWRNWGKKRGPANGEEEVKGPAPPAAVAAAAKIALASLGSNPVSELYVEPRKVETYNDEEVMESSPLIPANAALIERTFSGRWQVPPVSNAEGGDQNGFIEAWTESSAFGRPTTVNYQVSGSYHEAPLDNPEKRNRNLRWLRTHFRPLIDVGQLPFNNADMWQLHQYYFSPPYFADENDAGKKAAAADAEEKKLGVSGEAVPPAHNNKCLEDKVIAPPTTPVSSGSPKASGMGRAISFQALNNAVAAADLTNCSNKRRGPGEEGTDEETKQTKETEPSAKRTKSLKPRIAYYPRIRAKLESLGTKPLEQTLSLLRKLKYVENVIFPEHTAYEELDKLRESEHATRLDVEMILLDLI